MKWKLNSNKALKVFFQSMPKLLTGLDLVLCKYLPTCFHIHICIQSKYCNKLALFFFFSVASWIRGTATNLDKAACGKKEFEGYNAKSCHFGMQKVCNTEIQL